AFRMPRARPWLLAAGVALWVALGTSLGSWQLLGSLPFVNGMRAIGRAECLVVLFSIPAILICLESMPGKLGPLLLFFLILELVPGGLPERLSVEPAWFAPTPFATAMKKAGPTLILPDVDYRLMTALTST